MRTSLDIGSTNSSAAWFDGKAARMIDLADSSSILPSVVTIVDGDCLVGHDAIEAGRRNPAFMFRNWKRQLGAKWHDLEDTGYQTCEGPDGMLAYRGPDGHTYLPEELYSFVVQELLRATQDKLGEMPTGVVLCVPADFVQSQREAAERAVNLAMERMRDEDSQPYPLALELMHEPTAAALAYGYDSKKAKRIFVVDLGGGTLDCSYIQSGGGNTLVKTTNGIRDCGGADWDRMLADFVVSMWRTEHPDLADPGTRDAAMSLIMTEAEDVKKRLSAKTETLFRIDDFDREHDGTDVHLSYTITRKAFEEMTAPLIRRVIGACQIALEDAHRLDANFSIKDLHDVLLVGGMTRMPAVQEAVKAFFGKAPSKRENPEQAVALGAAIKAAMLDGRRPDLTINDISSHTLALEVSGDTAAILLPKGSPFPSEAAFSVTNETDGQKQISLRLIQGEAHRASVCELLASAEHSIEPVAAKAARVPLVARLDASGRPTVIVADRVIFGEEAA
jgi:molecular chaperone DnaK